MMVIIYYLFTTIKYITTCYLIEYEMYAILNIKLIIPFNY